MKNVESSECIWPPPYRGMRGGLVNKRTYPVSPYRGIRGGLFFILHYQNITALSIPDSA